MSQRRVVRKKKKRKQLTPLSKLLMISLIGLGLYFTYEVFSEIYKTIELRNQLALVQQQLEDIQDENIKLIAQKAKLEDPDYVQSYARGNYMLTKDGEEIYYLPSSNEE